MPGRRDVKATYDRIAEHFARTRDAPWPEVTRFLAGRSGGIGLDLGCGNARHVEPLAGLVTRAVGIDISRAALDTARSRAAARGFPVSLVQADAATIPVDADVVDVCVYVAALHHLPTRALRVRSLDEVARVLSDDGVALVSVWSTSHDRFDGGSGFDTTVDWTLPDGSTVPRYYHIYDGRGFAGELDASDLAVSDRFESSGNWFAVVRANGS